MDFLLRNIEYNQLLTYMILGSLVIITCIKLMYNSQFNEFIGILQNGKYLLLHNKKDRKASFFNSLFYIFFTINISLFSFIIYSKLELLPLKKEITLLTIFISVNIYFISKYFIEKIFFEILDLNSIFEGYNFQKVTYINLISVFIFCINTILLYIHTNPSNVFIGICAVTIFLLYLLSLSILIIYNQKLVLKHSFYFILYLCALEISPLLIGVILITN